MIWDTAMVSLSEISVCFTRGTNCRAAGDVGNNVHSPDYVPWAHSFIAIAQKCLVWDRTNSIDDAVSIHPKVNTSSNKGIRGSK